MTGKYIGIEFGGTKIQIVLGDENGNICKRLRYNVDKKLAAEGIRNDVENGITNILKNEKPLAIGAGFGGPINHKKNEIYRSYHVKGWDGFPLKKWLSDISGLPVIIDNDANIAGFAEALSGAGKGKNPVFYVTLGSGVGGGLIINKKIFHGAGRAEAEIGHVRFNQQCEIVENYCSGWAANKRIRSFIDSHSESGLAKIEGRFEAEILGLALAENNTDAQQLLSEIANDIAFSLSHVIHLINPEIIILGGGLSLLGKPLIKSIKNEIKIYIMDAIYPGPEIVTAALGEDVVPIGALLLARQFYLSILNT